MELSVCNNDIEYAAVQKLLWLEMRKPDSFILINTTICRPINCIILIRHNRQLAGFVQVSTINEPVGDLQVVYDKKIMDGNYLYIHQILLAPEFRGCGLGGQALQHLLNLWFEFDVYATVNIHNMASEALFKKAGFIECGWVKEPIYRLWMSRRRLSNV